MINWNDINFKGKTSGQIKTKCPACSSTRKNPDLSLSVNITDGIAKCHYCEEIAIRDKREVKQYKKPNQEITLSYSQKFIEYFQNRGISQDTLLANNISEEVQYFPSSQKKQNAIVFNYFEGAELVNKKFRSADKHFTQVKDAKKIFYGINHIIGQDEIYIVEGEIDKLSLFEQGIKNCISVPNGANDLNDVFENCEKYLKEVKKVHIAVDMDEKGQQLEQNLIKRFGKLKCDRIEFKNKDANEDLVDGVLSQTIKNAKPYPIEGMFSALDLNDDLLDLYDNGLPDPIRPKGKDWEAFNKTFSILRGQLTVVTGIPSHGKSSFLEWYVLNLVKDNNLMASFYSPEHGSLKEHFSVLSEKFVGKRFDLNSPNRMSKSELKLFQEWSHKHLFLTHPLNDKLPDWNWILDRFREQIFLKGVDVFVIDAWNKVKMKDRGSLGEISDVLSELTSFCQQHNVNIFLVAHPKKMIKLDSGQHQVPTLYDVSGSADFYNIAHNGLVVHRDFENKYITVRPLKIKMQHQKGEVNADTIFKWNSDNGRFYHLYKDDKILIDNSEQQSEISYIDIGQTQEQLIELAKKTGESPF